MSDDLERRGFAGELRLEGAGQGARLRGYAAIFDAETELWPGYREVIRRGAFAKSLAETRNAKKALWNHETSAPLASTAGQPPLRLWEDDRGLGFEFQVPQTQAGRELVELVRSGIVDGASFGFRAVTAPEKARNSGAGVVIVREILEAELFEISPVTHPAYADTTVALRARDRLRAHGAMGETMRNVNQVRAEFEELRSGAEGRALSPYEQRGERSLEQELDGASTRTTPAPRERPDAKAPAAIIPPEKRDYSLVRTFRAQMSGDWREAKLERYVADMLRERHGQDPHDERSWHVPYSALLPLATARKLERRDVTTSTAPSLVATDLVPDEFIELLRNAAMVVRAGARILPNLVGNVDIGRQNAAAVGGWIASEGADAVEGQLTTDKITLTPRTFGLYQELTRKILKQSTPGVEDLVREDLRRVIGLGIDLAALSGTGASGQPTGVLVIGGTSTVTHGAGVMTWSNLLEYESDLGASNAPSSRRAWFMRSSVRALAKGTAKSAGVAAGFLMESDGTMNGFPSFVTEQMPALGTTGALLFGDFSEIFIGMWGVLDLFADPFSKGNSGTVVVRGFQDADVGIRHAASFSKSLVL